MDNTLTSQQTSGTLIRTGISQKINNILLLNPGGPEIMMRGLIRERPTQYGFCWPSVDMIITSGILNQQGFDLTYLDASIDQKSVADVIRLIKDEKREAVVSLYSHFYHQNDIEYLQSIKDQCPDVKIIILSDIQNILQPQSAVDLLNQHGCLDAIIMSFTSHDLNRYLAGEQAENFKNLCYRINGKAHLGPRDVVSENDYNLPIPRHDLFKNKRYFLPASKYLYSTTSMMQFGCPYQCDFCLDKEAYKKSWCRSAENMVEEFEYIAKCGFREVYLRDLTFGLNRKRSQEFCELLIQKKVPLKWVCTTRVDVVDEEFLTLMKKAGCFCIEFGVESGIDKTKDIHKKGTKNAQAIRTFAICQRLGIETVMFMILGFPEENREDIQSSIQFAFDLKGDFLALNLANMLPETGFNDDNKREKSQDEAENPFRNFNFYTQNFSHPTIPKKEMDQIFKATLRRFYLRPSYMWKRLTKIRSFGALMKVTQIGFKVLQVSLVQKKKS